MSEEARDSSQIDPRQIPKFEFEINNDELKSCIKEINFQLKTQDKTIQKMKKELENRPSANTITEALVLVNSLIELDPGLSKLLKSRQKKESSGNDPISTSSNDLGRKINSISECMTVMNNSIKSTEKKVVEQEFSMKSLINEKVNSLQEQLDEIITQKNNQFMKVNEKIELNSSDFGDKLRQVQTKTLWQITECKSKLAACVNEQMVRDAMKELQSKTATKIKEEAIKQGSVDPERVQKIELKMNKQEKQVASTITEINYKIESVKENIENSLLSKKSFGDERIEIEKRFNLLNGNFSDIFKRVRNSQTDIVEEKEKISKLLKFEEDQVRESLRMNEVLKNMKIGEDFQKMLEKIDPHKICALDERCQSLQLNQEQQTKNLELARREVDRLRSKTEFCNIITPNADTSSKLNREDVSEMINEYFVTNQFAKKIHTLEAQFLEVKAFPEMLNDVNKKVSRFQKETDTHNLVYQLRGLQEYLKKEILIVNNRINSLEVGMNEEKKRRPGSGHKSHVSDGKMSSSISYKKLTPVNCISCYQNPMTESKKGLFKRY